MDKKVDYNITLQKEKPHIMWDGIIRLSISVSKYFWLERYVQDYRNVNELYTLIAETEFVSVFCASKT